MKSSGKENRTPETNENVRNYPDGTSASLTLPLIRRAVSLHDTRIKITWKAQTDNQKDPQHVLLYTPYFGEEVAIELPNDEMCIKFGLECLGRTCGARSCSEKETAREKRDVALERKGRVTGRPKSLASKKLSDPTRPSPLYRSGSHSAWCVFFLIYWLCPIGRRPRGGLLNAPKFGSQSDPVTYGVRLLVTLFWSGI